MGKIHKALEKSRRERQVKSKSGSLATFGNKISPEKSPNKETEGRKLGPTEPVQVSQGLDLGTIHELLHESGKTGVPKFSDKNDTAPKDIPDAAALKKSGSDNSPTTANPKSSVERIEKTITDDFKSGGIDNHKNPSNAKGTQDTQNFLSNNDAPVKKTDLPSSGEIDSLSKRPLREQKLDSNNNKKISNPTLNEDGDKKIFIFKEKILNETAREEGADKTVSEYDHKKDLFDFDSGSTKYSAVDKSLVALLKPRSYEAEQFKILRTNLLFPESGNPARFILITSAAPSDGKSFVSANLAVSLALDHDRKVILIDADVRRSEIHKIFGLNRVEKGICDFLADRIPLTSLLVKTSLKNLVILPAGNLTRNPDELQSLEKLPKLFEELAAHFGEYFIVIDSPPPKLASETGVLARLVDSIVIVMKAGVTKKEYVEETIDLLEKEKIVGIVFNWHDNRMSNYKKYAKDREYYS